MLEIFLGCVAEQQWALSTRLLFGSSKLSNIRYSTVYFDRIEEYELIRDCSAQDTTIMSGAASAW